MILLYENLKSFFLFSEEVKELRNLPVEQAESAVASLLAESGLNVDAEAVARTVREQLRK